MKHGSHEACVGSSPEVDPVAPPDGSGALRAYVPAPRSPDAHTAAPPPRLRRTGNPPPLPEAARRRSSLPPPRPPAPTVPEVSADDEEETRPLPRRTREDYVAVRAVGAALETLAAEATPWQVAACSASALGRALDAHAVLVLHHDEDLQHARIIGLHAPSSEALLGSAASVLDDYVVTALLTSLRPLALRLDGDGAPGFVAERHRAFDDAGRSLTAFPVIQGGRCVAVVEVVGVAEDRERVTVDACELVAQRLSAAFAARPARESGVEGTWHAPAVSNVP